MKFGETTAFYAVIYIVTTSALDFKQPYIFYRFYPVKRTYSSKRILYLAQTFVSI